MQRSRRPSTNCWPHQCRTAPRACGGQETAAVRPQGALISLRTFLLAGLALEFTLDGFDRSVERCRILPACATQIRYGSKAIDEQGLRLEGCWRDHDKCLVRADSE